MIAILGPYAHKDISVQEARVNTITSACVKLFLEGKTAITPLSYGLILVEQSKKDGNEIPDTLEHWKQFCLDFIEKCDEVYVLNLEGWDISRGVNAEITRAKELNIPVYLVDATTLKYIKVL